MRKGSVEEIAGPSASTSASATATPTPSGTATPLGNGPVTLPDTVVEKAAAETVVVFNSTENSGSSS
jgi:hypothetical protein